MAGAKDKVISSAFENCHGHGSKHALWQISGSSRGFFPGGKSCGAGTNSSRKGRIVQRYGPIMGEGG